MKRIFHTIQHAARAAAVLLLALLAAQTAGAEEAVTYIDMDGKTKTVTEYTEVTTDMNLYWSSGTYVVKSSVTLNGCIRYSGKVIDLIVCDGATLTVNGNEGNGAFDGNTLNIYAQSNGTGMGVVNVKKQTKCCQLNIAGGKVTLDADGKSYGLYVFSGDACGLTVNGGDVTIQNSDGSQGAIYFAGNGFVTLNGGKLTVTNSMEDGYTAIEGQDTNTINFNGGTAVINGSIDFIKNINLNSGNVTVNGEVYSSLGYTVTYDFTRATDSYYINAFSNDLDEGATRTVRVKDGVTFLCDGKSYSGTLSNKQISAISGKRMTPDVSDHFSVNDAGTEYTIHTATGWDLFCNMLEGGESFSGKTVRLGNDITVTRCAGSGAGGNLTESDRPFCGTFDGGGNKLTFNYGSSDTPADENNLAPFRYVNNATIQHLHVDGDIYTQHVHAGGIVGMAYGTTNITDCRSSVNIISSINGDGTHGGIMSCSWTGSTTSITGCLFDGSIQSASGYTTNQCGGFVGWRNATINVSNSLLTADLSTIDTPDGLTYPSATFVRNGNNNTITNCYYTEPFGTPQGKQTRTVNAGDGVTVAHAGVATHYATSGITAYKATGASADSDLFIAGLLYNNNAVDVLYAGSDEVVSLTLSNTGAPDGYQYGYTTNAGTLDGSTLTMPDQDVTVSVNTDVLTVLPWSGDGSKSSPYLIEYPSQLDLLAHRVNGTHGETCQEDGYYNTYFQLNNDIKYTPSDDWDDFNSHESNYEAIGCYYGGGYRYFSGHFNGNNKTISGIRIYKGGSSDADIYQGIFGRTDSGADIHDLTLADARITGYTYTGGIVGYKESGTVTRCHVAADVAVCAVQYDAWYHGGISGNNGGGTIEQCTSAATLTTLTTADANNSKYYGGIAGYNIGTLRDNLAIGAIVPAAKDNTYGAITGNNINRRLKHNYYAACKVAGTENATGVGCGYIDDGNGGRIVADVTANNGAVSIHTLTLADGITTSTPVTITIGTTGYYAQGTAIALSNSGTPGNIPLGYQYGFTASAGTLSGSTLTMPDQDVTVSVNTAILTAIPWEGDGTEGSPYIIKYASQLDLLAYRVNGTHGETCQEDGYYDTYFKLNNDIKYTPSDDWDDFDSDESNYEAIGGYYGGGNRSFSGHFDGNKKTISGIRIYKDGNGDADCIQGIFGLTSSGADIHDLTLADARITGYVHTGGIVGYNDGGTVSGCHVAADVAVCAVQSYAWYHGGIAGINDAGTIEQCTSAANLTTADADNSKYYGGIAGYNNNGTLSDNLAIGAIVPAAKDNSYGAITGYNVGSLQRNYYAACKVADTENATGVGCGCIDDGNGGRIVADVNNYNNPDGAVSIHTLTLAAHQAPDGNYWTTYYNGTTGFTIDKNENACAYTATYGGSQLTLHKLGKQIPKNTAVIIVADNDVVSMTTATDLDDFTDDNDLRGMDDDTPTSMFGDGTIYVLGMTTVGNEQHFGFHRYTGSTMAAHKAFVLVSGSQALARSLTMVFDDATGIESLTPDAAPKAQAADHWFTLDGRRLQTKPTAPGIYVNNGKKVVIK